MPLVDFSTSEWADRYYRYRTPVWRITHPTTGGTHVYIQGVDPPSADVPTTGDKRERVRVNHCRWGSKRWVAQRAVKLIEAAGLTSSSRVAIVGAGYGWLQEALESLLPGISCTSIDNGPYIHANNDETAELTAAITRAGIPESHPRFGEVLAFFLDGPKAQVTIHDEDISSRGARRRLGQFTHAVSEHVLEFLSDNEAAALNGHMADLAPNVVHMLKEYNPKNAATPEPGTLSNWKWLTEQRSIENGGVKQELRDAEFYEQTSWDKVVSGSTLVAT